MTRLRVWLSTIAPSMILGGFLFGSTAGHADAGRDGALGQWPAAPDAAAPRDRVAQADPWARTRPPMPPMPPMPPSPMVPPVPPLPPRPPMPPAPHGRRHGRGVSVSFHDGRLELEGVQELVQDQLDRVTEVLDTVQDLPPDVRERVQDRVRSVRDKLRTRLGKLRSVELDQLGPEMERMGDEIEKEMEGLDKDLAQFGDRFGEKFGQKLGQQFGKTFEGFGKDFAKRFNVGPGAPRINIGRDSDRSDDADDNDDDDEDRAAVAVPPGSDPDPDLRSAIGDLRGLTLDAGQKQRLAQLRAEADRQISDAQQELDAMSGRLHDALGDLGATEADIARQIDRISAKEATIRKARILTWVRARGLLSEDQRRRVEAAARRGH